MNRLSKLYLKYIPSGWALFLILIFLFLNGLFWLIEDFNNIEHKIYWYDVVSMMSVLAIGMFFSYIQFYADKNFTIISYKDLNREISNYDIVIVKKEENAK